MPSSALKIFSAATRCAFVTLLTFAAACGSDATGSNNVVEGEVASVNVTPATSSIDVGGTVQLRATVLDGNGDEIQGKTVAWSTSASTIASVSSTGAVTGVSAGNATVTATADGRRGTASITVVPRGTSLGTISVNGTQQYQTMTGWEALMEIGQAECDPRAYQTYRNEVLDRAANEVGVNRIRVGLRNGFENPVDRWPQKVSGQLTFNQWKTYWFQVVNDNSDPLVINPAGFNWGYLDYVIEQLIIPLKQRLRARGDDLWFNLSYTGANSGQLHRDNAEEYAEFILAAFQHIQQKYGLVPNSLELVNEPNLGGWDGFQVGRNLVAAKRRLNQAGFFPQFVGPTASSVYATLLMFDEMGRIPGAIAALNEISYHRFGDTQASYLQELAQRAAQHGMRTAMLEHGGSGHEHLHQDLTIANTSAWQQFGLAFCGTLDDGGMYFLVHGAKPGENSPVVHTGWMTKYLRQYYRYVGLQAVRVGATSSDARFAPVAFRNANGKYVVVVKTSAGGSFTVGGLPAGRYGIDYTTANEYMRALPEVTISGSQAVSTSIPGTGVLTIFAK
ncbi:MAG TPA: Ig-like domain-containing protein [Gemmatimonadaceae bacterium]|nr:Ig-like domain-containing protein [Gemmatimonadaceae bacterium]